MIDQIVQAPCPFCNKVLRIPFSWIGKPMRCKHCKQIFQGRARQPQPAATTDTGSTDPDQTLPSIDPEKTLPPPDAYAPPTTRPVSRPVARPVQAGSNVGTMGGFGGDMFDFETEPYSEAETTTQTLLPPRTRPKSNWKIKVIGVGTFLLVAVGITFFVGPMLTAMIKGENLSARNDDIPTEPVAIVIPKVEQKTEAKNPPKQVAPETKKKNRPGKKGPRAKNPEPKTTTPVAVQPPRPKTGAGPMVFPRRALFINANDYFLFNPLLYGSPYKGDYPGSSSAALAFLMQRPPFNIHESQIAELSDGIPADIAATTGRTPQAPLKSVIEKTVTDFTTTSRPQDRIILMFSGHTAEIEEKTYLIPIEGNLEEPKSLIPLTWLFDQLARCQARQKLLILDICRFPPARGLERPGSDKMSENLDKLLMNPPAGVQVWSSCVKGQHSIELDKGSVFVASLCWALRKGVRGIQEPDNDLPLEPLLPMVNQRMKQILEPLKMEQLSRLTGQEKEGGAPYNPDVPMPVKLVVQPPSLEGGDIAGAAQVRAIVDELNQLPPVRGKPQPLKTTHLPPFPKKVLDEYKADYLTWTALEEEIKDNPEKYPLRKAALEAIAALEESQKLVMEERLYSPGGGQFNAKSKEAFLEKQRNPGLQIFQLEQVLAKLKEVDEEYRDKETSKRWLANFDFTLARLESRLIFIYEYNYHLGQIRADNLPPLQPVHNGWRLGAVTKPQVNENKVRDMSRDIRRIYRRLSSDHAETPWALLAAREELTALGLEWRPSSD